MSLQEEFDLLVKAKEEKQQSYQTAQAKLESAKERMVELADEAKKLGVDDLDKLEEIIQAEELGIQKEMEELKKLLETDQPVSKTVVPVPPVTGPKNSLDELLEIGTSR